MQPRYLILFLVLLLGNHALSQGTKQSYFSAFQEQSAMLSGKKPISFKRSVFLTENAYYGDKLNYQSFCRDISNIAVQLRAMINQRGIAKYKTAGNWAAFTFMTDTIAANNFKPFTYDFDDFTGSKDWSKMFVTKLIRQIFVCSL